MADLFVNLAQLYNSLRDDPVEPGSDYYVDLFQDDALSPLDPVQRLLRTVSFSQLDSVQLFSGHRGTGKSTQLLRLKVELERAGYKVVYCDMEDYLPMTAPVDVVDFLLACAGALSEALAEDDLLGGDPTTTYWARFAGWLQSQRISVEELGLAAKAQAGLPDAGLGAEAGATVKLNLKADQEFRRRVRERMQLHVGAFVGEVHAYAQECLKALRARHGKDTDLVVIYDSIEHLRGTTTTADSVAASVDRLFRGHGDALRLPFLHTIYTVPPWLRLQTAATDAPYDSYCQVPSIKVRARDGSENRPGLDAMYRLASRRGDMTWLLGSREAFDELARMSGGSVRDLFRMLRWLCIDADGQGQVPVAEDRLQLAIHDLRNQYQGFTNQDAVWLRRIDKTGQVEVDAPEQHQRLAAFFDTHLVLEYRNGGDWYGVHPIIRELVLQRAASWDERHPDGD